MNLCSKHGSHLIFDGLEKAFGFVGTKAVLIRHFKSCLHSRVIYGQACKLRSLCIHVQKALQVSRQVSAETKAFQILTVDWVCPLC